MLSSYCRPAPAQRGAAVGHAHAALASRPPMTVRWLAPMDRDLQVGHERVAAMADGSHSPTSNVECVCVRGAERGS
jgi:hypothetical protein